MLIAYYSKTGNVKRFVDKISNQFRCVSILDNSIVQEKFILVTPTHGFGLVPKDVETFLNENHANLVAVASSGNNNWGVDLFAKSGEIISEKYNVPLLIKFENSGFPSDIKNFVERVHELGKMD
ncbi:class Ib ribonucleoside-diphosphate reductase assembly flavoprotein NrdI [Brevibacillus laterosporus]|uniref:class Ib ribonucleoside-diphosphate reductase assembly flavoprotein NrdI n=1 Tax=Brevibacillus laterosporus TaxID=1465 RepID=UPI00215CBD68|nr:class Ib ribonucleoside-diphosphate reductase assembly flavoprotein NrdI [Brevibacillus laterosporus]MCR8994562.1 class Ib ribonucleoside-diphosphate reductase assembly flavoprotein NrdI [Brevibacillus laterosporus]